MAAKGSNAVAPRRVLEMMKEATGASDEDICVMLQLCGGDANEATEKLLESERAARDCLQGPRGLRQTRAGRPRARSPAGRAWGPPPPTAGRVMSLGPC
jgi:hypothetical protein